MSTDEDRRLCIVGAGLAGAGIADSLSDESIAVTVLEKSRGVGGRAATRRRDGCRYDHGANYIKDSDERTRDLLESLGTEGFVDIDAPVWPFDADGTISESERPEAHKWTWEAGITQLAKRLFARTDAEVRKQTRVESIQRDPDGWQLIDTNGSTHGRFDAVVLTPPAPQTADLLRATEIGDADGTGNAEGEADADLAAAAAAVDDVPYRTIRSVILHYPFEIERPYYALVNDDREHDIGWLARESCKPGHIPDGEELLVAQMAPDWSSKTSTNRWMRSTTKLPKRSHSCLTTTDSNPQIGSTTKAGGTHCRTPVSTPRPRHAAGIRGSLRCRRLGCRRAASPRSPLERNRCRQAACNDTVRRSLEPNRGECWSF